jgi:hypothetical protein
MVNRRRDPCAQNGKLLVGTSVGHSQGSEARGRTVSHALACRGGAWVTQARADRLLQADHPAGGRGGHWGDSMLDRHRVPPFPPPFGDSSFRVPGVGRLPGPHKAASRPVAGNIGMPARSAHCGIESRVQRSGVFSHCSILTEVQPCMQTTVHNHNSDTFAKQ